MNNLCTRFINSIDTSWPFDFVQSVFTKEDISNIPTLTGQPMSYDIVYLSTITVCIKQLFVYDNGYNGMVLFVICITKN